MAGRVVGSCCQRLTVALLGLGVPALHLQCDRQIAQPAMTLFQCRQRCAVMRFCLDRVGRSVRAGHPASRALRHRPALWQVLAAAMSRRCRKRHVPSGSAQGCATAKLGLARAELLGSTRFPLHPVCAGRAERCPGCPAPAPTPDRAAMPPVRRLGFRVAPLRTQHHAEVRIDRCVGFALQRALQRRGGCHASPRLNCTSPKTCSAKASRDSVPTCVWRGRGHR